MSEVREQKRRIEDLQSTKYITGALRDISAIELTGLRERFDRNTSFADELRELYGLVWTIGERSGQDIKTQKKNNALYVAYTTNRHFFGALNLDIIQKLIQSTSTSDQCLIIGDTGKEIWRTQAKKRRETSFMSFVDDAPNSTEITGFLQKTAEYRHVYMLYPGFVSVFKQEPVMQDITFRPAKKPRTLDEQDTKQQKLATNDVAEYLLEPNLTEMLAFFHLQVRYVLFERMLLETQLSRVSARLVKMDTADQNTDLLVRAQYKELRRAYASFSSRRMIETLVGYLQWHTQKI
jgi:ATP synthase F1 gamma subunit